MDVMADIIEERFSNINVIRYKGKDVFTLCILKSKYERIFICKNNKRS